MQFINRHVDGHQEVGHIDLLSKFSYIEVPEHDADKVMRSLDGATYKGRSVRCNDADSRGSSSSDRRGGKPAAGRKGRRSEQHGEDGFERYEKKSRRRTQPSDSAPLRESGRKDDWKQFFRNDAPTLKGDEPDFSEEGWARRRPLKK